MEDKVKNKGTRETKTSIMRGLKNKSKKKPKLTHQEILRANNMEEPDIWNLQKE